jgi:hypothetical protein
MVLKKIYDQTTLFSFSLLTIALIGVEILLAFSAKRLERIAGISFKKYYYAFAC